MLSSWSWNEIDFHQSTSAVIVADHLFPEIRYARRHVVPLLPNGSGPFCEFVVPNLPEASGVYAIFLDGSLKYVGRALNLKKRFYDYGHIAPRKCYRNGQSTNIAMNKRVREALRVDGKIAVLSGRQTTTSRSRPQ
jgi:hypothetical protein